MKKLGFVTLDTSTEKAFEDLKRKSFEGVVSGLSREEENALLFQKALHVLLILEENGLHEKELYLLGKGEGKEETSPISLKPWEDGFSPLWKRPYRPKTQPEGAAFEDRFCGRCARWNRDAPDCEIWARVNMLEVFDPNYPTEWIHDRKGEGLCTAFETKPTKKKGQAK